MRKLSNCYRKIISLRKMATHIQFLTRIADDYIERWTLNQPLSLEFAAGMVVGSYLLMKEDPGLHRLIITLSTGEQINLDLSTPSEGERVLTRYLRLRYIPGSDIKQYVGPSQGYGWWINNLTHSHERFDLYVFTTEDFPQGLITICDAFWADFRDYIAGAPFQYDTILKRNRELSLTGYDIAPYDPEVRPVPVAAPYYSMVDEADRYGADYAYDYL